jgi:hypothetical protein
MRFRSAFLALLALAVAACDVVTPASVAPSATQAEVVVPPAPTGAEVVSCISIQTPECSEVAERILAALPGALGDPFSIQVRLFRCANDAQVCPRSLAAREGQVVVEYPDGGEVRVFHVEGPPVAPVIELEDDVVLTDPIQPGSPPVAGSGPFEFEVGHCGLAHVVDFNGSFWVLVGPIDGEQPVLINSERGLIRLQNQDRAQYVGAQNVVFQLARFPGAKRFQLCD